MPAPPQRVEPSEPARLFSAPAWLRDLGRTAWLLVGVAIVVVGGLALLGAASDIVAPVLAASVVAAVAAPALSWLARRWHLPRAAGAALVLLGLIGLGLGVLLMVFGGIVGQSDEIRAALSKGSDRIDGWANDAGAAGTADAQDAAAGALSEIGAALLEGVVNAAGTAISLALFLSFFFFSTFFLLKDGPVYRRFIDGHLGIPRPVATIVTGDIVTALRNYFYGVTLVAAFNAVLVGIGALVLGVPLAGTIAVVTFVAAYVPFIGAFVSGAFAVVIALGSEGTEVALVMLVIVLLANGLLQQVVQPIAFGATLDLNPLAVLIATIAGGAIFGMTGLVLAAPLTSAAVHISRDVAAAKAAAVPSAAHAAEP